MPQTYLLQLCLTIEASSHTHHYRFESISWAEEQREVEWTGEISKKHIFTKNIIHIHKHRVNINIRQPAFCAMTFISITSQSFSKWVRLACVETYWYESMPPCVRVRERVICAFACALLTKCGCDQSCPAGRSRPGGVPLHSWPPPRTLLWRPASWCHSTHWTPSPGICPGTEEGRPWTHNINFWRTYTCIVIWKKRSF